MSTNESRLVCASCGESKDETNARQEREEKLVAAALKLSTEAAELWVAEKKLRRALEEAIAAIDPMSEHAIAKAQLILGASTSELAGNTKEKTT